MSNNVFNIFARQRPEFTDLEKTRLGDVAMDFRDKGIQAALYLNPSSLTPLAKFIDKNTGELYLYVSRHHDEGAIRYRISPKGQNGFDTILFDDVLIACRQHIKKLTSEKVLLLQTHRQNLG